MITQVGISLGKNIESGQLRVEIPERTYEHALSLAEHSNPPFKLSKVIGGLVAIGVLDLIPSRGSMGGLAFETQGNVIAGRRVRSNQIYNDINDVLSMVVSAATQHASGKAGNAELNIFRLKDYGKKELIEIATTILLNTVDVAPNEMGNRAIDIMEAMAGSLGILGTLVKQDGITAGFGFGEEALLSLGTGCELSGHMTDCSGQRKIMMGGCVDGYAALPLLAGFASLAPSDARI